MKIIAVSQRIDYLPDRNETRDSLDQNIVSLLKQCGIQVIPIPNCMESELYDYLNKLPIEGIILSGGNELGEYVNRDKTEEIMISFAYRRKLPLLAICRGMQMLASLNGSRLIEIDNHVNKKHEIKGLYNATVSSFHNYSIDKIPEGFDLIASTKDGSIEGIRHKKLNWEGWMWHPERENPYNNIFIQGITKIFK